MSPVSNGSNGSNKSNVPARQGLTPRAEKATKKLLTACTQLCEALARAGPVQRQAVISSLSQGLRQELICVREAQSRANARSGARTGGSLPTAGATSRSLRGNIWCVKTAVGCYYRVRMTLDKVCITSSRLQRRELAQKGLAQLRGAAKLAVEGGGSTDTVLRAMDAAGASTSYGEGGLGLSYQALLDCRGLLGKRLHSPSVSVEEAILLRRQVCDLEDGGPTALARTWLHWAQELRHRRGRLCKWPKEKADRVFAQMQSSTMVRRTSKTAKRLQLWVRRAEAALVEVAKVSDAVSATKRRWLPLGAASQFRRRSLLAPKAAERRCCHGLMVAPCAKISLPQWSCLADRTIN